MQDFNLHFSKRTLRNMLLTVVGAILVYWLLHDIERVSTVFGTIWRVLSPFIAGATLAFILNVPMRAFERMLKGIKHAMFRRILALLLTFIAILLVLALVFWLLVPELIETFDMLEPQLTKFFNDAGVKVGDYFGDFKLDEWFSADKGMDTLDSLSAIIGKVFSALGSAMSLLMDVVIAFVFAIYCLFQKETLARQGRKILYAFLKESKADYVVRVMRLTNSTFANFLSGQCVEVCILGGMFAITMAIFGMDYIPLISVLVAVTAFIPIVGAWVGCAIGAFLLLVTDPMQAVGFVVLFIILQQIENNLIYPRVVGTSIGLSGMWVLVAIAVGGELLGVVGMLLMIPMASVLQNLFREVTADHLTDRKIPQEKLQAQPPELRSRFKKKKK